MSKLLKIMKYSFHIIYLIGVNLFKILKGVANVVLAIFKGVYKGLKYFFSVIIPKIFKNLFKVFKTLFVVLYKELIILVRQVFIGIKWSIIKLLMLAKYLVKLFIQIIKIIISELILLVRNVISGIVGSAIFLYKNGKIIAVAVAIAVVAFIKAIPIYIRRWAVWFYKKFIYIFYREFTDIFRYSVLGVYLIFMGVFYEGPKYVIVNFPIWMKLLKERIKDFAILAKQWINDLPNKIKAKFSSLFNNSIFVKNYRNKKLLQFENLTTLQIDTNSQDAIRGAVKTTFRYLVKNADGKFIKGYFSAFSKLDCHSYLLDEGYEVYKIETSKWIEFMHGERKYFNVVMAKKDLIFWLTQLSTYIKSGVPLTDAAKILAAQDKRNKYKKIYDEIIYELTMGESFSKALEKQGSVFPALLVNMIKAAEMMGDIENTLDDMAAYYSDIESTKKEMKSAMTYPMLVACFSMIIIVFILTYIIPQFQGIYDQAGIEMNSMTLLVINASHFLMDKWWVIVLIIVGVVASVIFLYKNLKAFKTVAQYLLMHMPVIGKVMIYNEMVLFAKTFSSLQKNNVLLTDSIDILSKITNNEIYKVIMLDTITNLLKGDKMSDSFKDNWAIPELAFYMISTGERTGDLAAMLEKVAAYYQEQQKAMVTVLKAFIEPIMIAVLAIVVGGIIVAAILPMFSMYSGLM